MTDFIPPGLRAKFEEWLGRDPHPSGAAKDIWHLAAPGIPEFRFEWHPKRRNVYLIRTTAAKPIGEIIAFNIETHGDAHNAVLIFLRGYREGKTPGIKHHLAE
jgi:hypothetical protein